jgi:hypothetical protein
MSSRSIGRPSIARRVATPAIAAAVTAVLVFACSNAGGTPPAPPTLESSAGTAEPSATATTEASPTLPAILAAQTAGPTATAYPSPAEATTNGVLYPFYDSVIATRKPIAVMLDDHWAARPQAGLSQADIVYQALAEGGIPRYMAVFQTQDPPLIGPIRSARGYFVAWAEEWKAMYVHVWGAPDAMSKLATDNGVKVWNADGLRWLGNTYMWRVDWRVAPHNAYTDGLHLRALLAKLGGTSPSPKTPWAFGDPVPEWLRPVGGSIDIPYFYNRIQYEYDRASNTYLRSHEADVIHHKMAPEIDPNNDRRVAPSVVVIMFMDTYLMAGHANIKKGRLELDYLGQGKAWVFENGTVVGARWNKARETSQTTITYASGPDAGKPVPFVRGQIFIQVVPPDTAVTYTLGTTVAPEH